MTRDVPILDRRLIDRLRDDLTAAAFTVDGIRDLLGPVASAALDREQAVPAVRVARASDEPLAVLVRLFLLGDHPTAREVAAALPTLGMAGASDLGLVDRAGQGDDDPVRPRVDLQPYESADRDGPATWWIASDLAEIATGGPLRPDHVLGVGGASRTLAEVTVRTPRERVLDLGTGCGIQALLATRHAHEVVGTDVLGRALGFAAFNAALAGVEVDLRQGSLVEPVVGERFDLIVSNPPFVVTPAGAGLPRYVYRDGGLAADDLARSVVAEVPGLLRAGGVAQFLVNWEHRAGTSWRDRVTAWIEDGRRTLADSSDDVLDAWVIEREVLDPAQYAQTWLRDGGLREDDVSGYRRAMTAYLDDFDQRDVEAVGFGYVLVRRRPRSAGGSEGPWTRLEEIHGPVRQPLGEHLAGVLDTIDRMPSDVLGDVRLVVASDVTEERHHRPGAADPEIILLRQGGGFGRAVQADTATAAFVGACDGELTAAQITGALSVLLDQPVDGLRAALAGQVTGLLRDGFLTVTP